MLADPLNVLRDRYHQWKMLADNVKPPAIVLTPKEVAAILARRECKAHTLITGDEDGPFKEPVEVTCRLPEGHEQQGRSLHYNGYTNWSG